MPIDESIFTEDIEALDEDYEAVDEAVDESFDEDFGEAVRNDRKGSRNFGGRGTTPSSGAATRNSFNSVARGQQNLYGKVTTPAGTAKVEIPPTVASKKDLKGLTQGISKDMQQNKSAINSINKSLDIADKNLSKNKKSLEKKVTALQLSSLAALVIAPQLTSFNSTSTPLLNPTTKAPVLDASGNAINVVTVSQPRYNYLFPLIVAIAIPLMVNSSKGTGPGANIWPLVLILGLVILNTHPNLFNTSGTTGTPAASGTGNFLTDNAPLLIVGVVILLTMTDSKIFG